MEISQLPNKMLKCVDKQGLTPKYKFRFPAAAVGIVADIKCNTSASE